MCDYLAMKSSSIEPITLHMSLEICLENILSGYCPSLKYRGLFLLGAKCLCNVLGA